MVGQEDVPVVFPNFHINIIVNVVVQATIDEFLAAIDGKLNTAHWNATVVWDQGERAFLFIGFQHVPQKTDARCGTKVFCELIQFIRVEDVKTSRKVSLRLSLFIKPMEIL